MGHWWCCSKNKLRHLACLLGSVERWITGCRDQTFAFASLLRGAPLEEVFLPLVPFICLSRLLFPTATRKWSRIVCTDLKSTSSLVGRQHKCLAAPHGLLCSTQRAQNASLKPTTNLSSGPGPISLPENQYPRPTDQPTTKEDGQP